MNIFETVGVLTIIYFVAAGIVAHLYVLHHGGKRIAARNRAGQLHEHEAEKTLADMRYPVVR